MLRRSSSSSHIPIPRSLFNADSGNSARKRSASAARPSQRNSTTSIAKPSRRSSTERKLSLNRLSRQNSPNRLSRLTPQTGPKRARSSGLQWDTPNSEQKILFRAGSSVKSQERKKTIQKLSTDAKWVSIQFAKVKYFISNSGLFDSSIVTENNIYLPSLKVFIYVTTVLMKEIFPNFKMTNENYKEVITEKLKVLRYPGVIANSVLKTVYAKHVWPQVIGMLGWLVDKVSLRSERTDNLDILDPECRQKYEITKACRMYILERYSIFNSDNSEERHLRLNEELVMKLTHTLEVDPNKYKQLEADLLKNKEYTLKQDKEITALQENIQKVRDAKDHLQNDIDERLKQDAVTETQLKEEKLRLEQRLAEVRQKKTATGERVAQLEASIKTQSCSFLEKKSLLKEIDSLRNKIKLRREKMELAQKIKQEFDAKLEEERAKLQTKVCQWNNFLMKWTIKKPQLKPLLLKENGFHHPSYLTELQEVLKEKIAIESYFADELQRIGVKFQEENIHKNNLELELEELKKSVDELTLEMTETYEIKAELEAKARKLITEWEITKKSLEHELKLLRENNTVENLGQQAQQLQSKHDILKEEVEKFAKKTLAFFLDLNNQVVKDVQEMKKIRNEVIERQLERQKEEQDKLIEMLEKAKEELKGE